MTAPPGNDLIVTPEGPSWHEGAGIISDAADVWDAFTTPSDNAGEAVYQGGAALAGFGLSALGVVQNPLESLAGAGLGWLIEHVDFLREPLDQLAGNPREIKAHAQTWHNVGRELARIADDHDKQVNELQSWGGTAADAYRAAAQEQSKALRQGAASAEELSGQVMSSATMVATVRSLVRDTIVDFVIKLAQWAIPAVASAVATVGASLAPIIAGAVASAVQTASKIAELISKLLKHLDDAGLAMGKIASSVEQIATGLANKANGVRQAGDAVADGFRQLSTGEVPAALRGGRPLPEWLGGGPNSTRINLDLPGSPGEAVRRFNEDLLSPQTGAKVILEPHKQNGAEIRDENNWREEDRK